MKHTLLLIVIISLFGYVTAQQNTWEVYLQGQAVKSIDFEDDNVWALTDEQVVCFNKTINSETLYPVPETGEIDRCHSLKITPNGKKWISTYWSVHSLEGANWVQHIVPVGIGVISGIEADRTNNLWITVSGFGVGALYKYDGVSFSYNNSENSDLPYDLVFAVTADKAGNIWMGNTNRNATDLTLNLETMTLVKNDGENWTSFPGPASIFTKMIFEDMGHLLWIQGNDNKLFKWDLSDNSWSQYLTLDENYSLEAVDSENNLWFVNEDNGIAVYNGSDWSFITTSNSGLPSDTVYQIAIDSDGTKWIATANGLAALRLMSSVESNSKPMNEVVLYPNPAHDFITLEIPNALQNSTVDIINISGQVIKSFSLAKNQKLLDISNIPAGVYLVSIQMDGNHILKKIVKH